YFPAPLFLLRPVPPGVPPADSQIRLSLHSRHFSPSQAIQTAPHEPGNTHQNAVPFLRSDGSELPPDALPHLLSRSKRRLSSIHSPIHTFEYENDTECR